MLTVSDITAREACNIKQLPHNTVLISINEEHEGFYPLELDRGDERILTLQFSDITAGRESMGKEIHPISGEQVLEVLRFVEKFKHKNFITHCAAGVSRSAAIALYINNLYGHKLKDDFWQTSNPNSYVLGYLIKYYNKYIIRGLLY